MNNKNNELNSHIENIKNEAERMDTVGFDQDYASRILSEVKEDIDLGIYSYEEGVNLIAKLDIVLESTNDSETEKEVQNLKQDIIERYPELKKYL